MNNFSINSANLLNNFKNTFDKIYTMGLYSSNVLEILWFCIAFMICK